MTRQRYTCRRLQPGSCQKSLLPLSSFPPYLHHSQYKIKVLHVCGHSKNPQDRFYQHNKKPSCFTPPCRFLPEQCHTRATRQHIQDRRKKEREEGQTDSALPSFVAAEFLQSTLSYDSRFYYSRGATSSRHGRVCSASVSRSTGARAWTTRLRILIQIVVCTATNRIYRSTTSTTSEGRSIPKIQECVGLCASIHHAQSYGDFFLFLVLPFSLSRNRWLESALFSLPGPHYGLPAVSVARVSCTANAVYNTRAILCIWFLYRLVRTGHLSPQLVHRLPFAASGSGNGCTSHHRRHRRVSTL